MNPGALTAPPIPAHVLRSSPSRPRQSAEATADQQRRADAAMEAGRALGVAMRQAYESATHLRRGVEPRELVAQAAEQAQAGLRGLGEVCGVVTSPCVACLTADLDDVLLDEAEGGTT